ncbi:MAG: YcfL family protein [Verrucomicrobia bacterium]|nr:YcfL family protein [Verrucomicrobiota bacterium]
MHERKEARSVPNPVEDTRVVTDSSLAKKARVVGIQEARVAGGFLKIQCELLNTTRGDQTVNFLFEWFDSDGMLVKTPMSRWQTVRLSAGEAKTVDATAPTKEVVDFRFKLKEKD